MLWFCEMDRRGSVVGITGISKGFADCDDDDSDDNDLKIPCVRGLTGDLLLSSCRCQEGSGSAQHHSFDFTVHMSFLDFPSTYLLQSRFS